MEWAVMWKKIGFNAYDKSCIDLAVSNMHLETNVPYRETFCPK